MALQTQEQDDTIQQQNLFENLTQATPVQILLKIHQIENSYGQRKPPNIEEIRNKIETPYSYVSENITEMTPDLIQKKVDGSSRRVTLTDRGKETVRLLRQLQQTLRGEE